MPLASAIVSRSTSCACVRRDQGQRPSSARLFWSMSTTTMRGSASGAAPSTSLSYTQASNGAVTPDSVTRIASAAAPTAVSRRDFHLGEGAGVLTGPRV